jgi:hypothetical protein
MSLVGEILNHSVPFVALGEELIRLTVLAILISHLYLLLIDGFMNNVTFSRLTKASFKLNIFSIINLWAAYFVSAIIFIYLYSEAPTFLKIASPHELMPSDVVLISLVAIYIGRIVTKNSGVFYGRVYYSTLLAFASLFFMFNLFILIGYNNLSIEYLTKNAIGFVHKNSYIIVWAIPGTLILSTLGEFMLSKMRPTKRSLMCVSEKLPSNFLIATGMQQIGVSLRDEVLGDHHGTVDKLREMLTSNELNQIRCFTRSLWIVDKIEKIAEEEGILLDTQNFKIIKLPDGLAKKRLAEDACKRSPSIDYLLNRRQLEFYEDYDAYVKRSGSLYKYDVKDYDIGDLRFVIVEYSNKTRNMMIFTKDTGPIGNIVGAYSDETYIIQIFNNIFDLLWQIAEITPKKHLVLNEQVPWWHRTAQGECMAGI